jgi:predicted dienelactone hydrolase
MKTFKVFVFFCVLLLLISGVPAQKASIARRAPDPEQQGPFEIGFTYFMLQDTSRSDAVFPTYRPIPVYVWYPVDPGDINGSTPAVYPIDPIFGYLPPSISSDWEAFGADPVYQEPLVSSDGPFPLVVFSPGWGGPAWGHIFLAARLASHGFVVAVTHHHGDWIFPWEPFDHIATACVNRPRDISFMLTDLLNKNGTPGEVLYGAIISSQVAASGWSLGGYASMTLAGGDDSVCDKIMELGFPGVPSDTCVPTPPDPRIKLILPFDGSNQVLYFDELARISVPTMGMGQEWSALEAQDPAFASWQARQHSAIQGHPCYRVDLADADHVAFCNICEAAYALYETGHIDEVTRDMWIAGTCAAPIPRSEVHRLISKYAIAFLKKYLAHEQGYKKILTQGYALKEPYIEFFVTEKRNPNSIDDDWPDHFWYFKHQPGSDMAKAEKNPTESMPIVHMGLAKKK